MIEDNDLIQSIEDFVKRFAQQENLRVTQETIYYNQRFIVVLTRNVQHVRSMMTDVESREMRVDIAFDIETSQLISWGIHRNTPAGSIGIDIADVEATARDIMTRYITNDSERDILLLVRPTIRLIESVIGKPNFHIDWIRNDVESVCIEVCPIDGRAIGFIWFRDWNTSSRK